MNYFILGSLTTLSVRATLANLGIQIVQDTLLNLFLSLAGGILSAVIVAWLQRRWQNRRLKP